MYIHNYTYYTCTCIYIIIYIMVVHIMNNHYVHVYVHLHMYMYMYKYMYVSVRKLPVKVAFTSKQTLKTSLTLPKPRMEKTGVVYAIHCEYGGTYLGETGRTLKIIMTEHKRAIRLGYPHNAISVHVNNTGHNIK